LLSIAPIQFAVFNTLSLQANQQFQAVIRDRLDGMRGRKPGDIAIGEAATNRYAAFAPPVKSYRAGAEPTADQSSNSRWGSFVTAQGASGGQDETARQAGFASQAYSLIGGLDYRFTPSFVLGGALGYQYSRSNFDFDRGSIAADTYTASGFFNWSAESGPYIDGIVSYSWNRYDSTRNFTAPTGPGTTARQAAASAPNGERINAYTALGYNVLRGPYSFAPFLSVNYIYQHVDSFSESGPSTVNLNVPSQTLISLASGVGVQGNRAFSRSWGVLSLTGRAEWKHEFRNDAQVLPMTFQADPVNGTFFVPTDAPDRNYYIVSIGTAAQFAAGKSAFLQYETVLGLSNVTNHILSAGVRIDF
jgi:outer membrane autotransporter protein